MVSRSHKLDTLARAHTDTQHTYAHMLRVKFNFVDIALNIQLFTHKVDVRNAVFRR